jgi:hypothetical protein
LAILALCDVRQGSPPVRHPAGDQRKGLISEAGDGERRVALVARGLCEANGLREVSLGDGLVGSGVGHPPDQLAQNGGLVQVFARDNVIADLGKARCDRLVEVPDGHPAVLLATKPPVEVVDVLAHRP